MRSLLLITDENFGLEQFEEITSDMGRPGVYSTNRKRYAAHDGHEYVALEDYNVPGGVYYEPGELDDVALKNPRFYNLEYSSISWIRPVLARILCIDNVWVHNDIVLRPAPAFLERALREPDWDFNYDP